MESSKSNFSIFLNLGHGVEIKTPGPEFYLDMKYFTCGHLFIKIKVSTVFRKKEGWNDTFVE